MNAKIFLLLIAALLGGVALIDMLTYADPRPAPITLPMAGRLPLGVTIQESDLAAGGWRASQFTSAEVYNDRNERIGRLDDLIVAADGSLAIAVVELGPHLGLGRRLVAIPARQLVRVSSRLVLLGATKAAIERMPSFKYPS